MTAGSRQRITICLYFYTESNPPAVSTPDQGLFVMNTASCLLRAFVFAVIFFCVCRRR
jgi:hypothetical protein